MCVLVGVDSLKQLSLNVGDVLAIGASTPPSCLSNVFMRYGAVACSRAGTCCEVCSPAGTLGRASTGPIRTIRAMRLGYRPPSLFGRYSSGYAPELCTLKRVQKVGKSTWQGTSFFYAGYILTTRRARARVDTFTSPRLLLSSLLLLLALNLAAGNALTGYTNETWSALVALGLISQLGGWLPLITP